MGFIEREMARIECALRESTEGERRYDQLYAAQQALKWTTEPQGFAAPLDMIERSGQRATDTLEEPEGYLAESRPLRS